MRRVLEFFQFHYLYVSIVMVIFILFVSYMQVAGLARHRLQNDIMYFTSFFNLFNELPANQNNFYFSNKRIIMEVEHEN